MTEEHAGPPTEMLRETSRKLAEATSSELDDRKRSLIAEGARSVIEGLRSYMGDDQAAAGAAVCFVKLLTMMSQAPVGSISDVLDHTIAGYSMAAGSLMGVYTLPEAPKDERHTHAASTAPENERLATPEEVQHPAGFRYL